MSLYYETSGGPVKQTTTAPVDVLKLRMIELLAFFAIVFVAREIAGFVYKTNFVVALFVGAAFLQAGGQFFMSSVGRRLRWRAAKTNSAWTWYSSTVDILCVLGIIHLTGGVGSPFLFLLAVPLFFVVHTFPGRQAPLLCLMGMAISVAGIGYLEMHRVIPHYNCFPFENDIYLNEHFYVGSLLVLSGFLGLILFLAGSFRYSFTDSVEVLRQKDKESKFRIQELARLYDISLGINAVMTVETLLKMVAKEATMLTSQPWASIVLFNAKREVSHVVSVGGQENAQSTHGTNSAPGRLAQWIIDNKKPVVVEDVRRDERASGEQLFATAGIRSVIGFPLNTGQRILGVFYVGDFVKKRVQDKHVRLLSIMCDQLVIAIAKSTLYETLQRKITDYEKKIDELEDVNRLKLEYVSHVSHELRTPLTSIKAYVETLEEHVDNPDFKEKSVFLAIVGKETERLIRIVNDVLDVSNIEFGERPLERRPLNLAEITDEVVTILRPKLDMKNITLDTHFPENLPRVDADKDLTMRVIINLITNAVKYSPEGTTIRVRGKEEPVNIQVSVEDEGIGIPAVQLGYIFDRYYRVRSAKSRVDDGVGLGLAIVKNIIDRHGGTIHVESKEGVGSKFVFTLPKEHCVNDLLGYLSEMISSRRELHEMLDLIVRMIAELLSAKMISLMLLDRTRSELFIKVSYGLDEWVVERVRVKMGEGIAGKVAATGRPLLIDNIEDNQVHSTPNNPQYETVSLLSAPLIVNGIVVGVINVNNKMSGKKFDQDDLNLLVSFGERISKALERLRSAEGHDLGLRDTVEALKKMVNRQTETKAIERIVDLAVKTSRKLHLSDKEVKVIQYVASVHDIGMTEISDEILNKTFNLTAEEIEQIRTHPLKGTELMRPLEFVELVSNIILYHHERVDGKGYPLGLKGDQIPLGSRILAVIDAYQSMMTEKPYRDPLSETDAAKELVDCAGRQFDPEVVDRFIEVLVDERAVTATEASQFKRALSGIVESDSW